ncbi:MAG: hypothetical protein CSA24_00630 [Deltaproteobacteria bacterium]|nr:MAG: hypothetical protein CSB49_05785 [Pseudomonadota bacterium]PIE66250.1 MAG: hypothetical protein CSA24_00630 [Deltaproteobacteria bacterium]
MEPKAKTRAPQRAAAGRTPPLCDVLDALPDAAFVVDQAQRVIGWNRGCEELSGVSRGEVLGKAGRPYARAFLGDPTQPMLIDLVDALRGDEGREVELAAPYGQVQRLGQSLVAELTLPQGSEGRQLQAEAKPLCDASGAYWGAIEVLRDVSERKRFERKLMAQEREYRELMMLANSIILRWSPEGVVTFINEFGQRFFGYSADELVGRHVMDTIVPADETTGRDLRELMNQVCADPKSFERNTNENVRKDGQRAWIDWTNKVVLGSDGEIREILSIGSDVTERILTDRKLAAYREHLEEQVAARTADLAAAKDRAESADRLKSAFLATMSHELRTPLNSIIGFTGILLQKLPGPLNDEQEKQLKMVQGSGRHLLALISDVLDISKIEAGQLEIAREPFDVGASLASVVATIEPSAEAKGLRLITAHEAERSPLVGDQRRFEQILLNLLSNAVKFTERGSIALATRTHDGFFEATVTDTGIGIAPDDQAKLFVPFFQVDTRLGRKYEGTGLGLSICRRLAELMGGTTWVQSELGRGSTFGFRLPVAGDP